MSTLRIVCALALLGWGSSGWSQEVLIGDSSVFKQFLDVGSVKMRNGYLTAWNTADLYEPESGVVRRKFLGRYDCANETRGIVSLIAFDGVGDDAKVVVRATLRPHEVIDDPVAPGSMAGSELSAVCYAHQHGSLEGWEY